MLNEGIQDFIKKVGDEGCYALCLCKIAELYIHMYSGIAVARIEAGVKKGYIAEDMTVLDGAGFLGYMTAIEWTKEYKAPDYKPVAGDYLVAEWFNPRTKLTHFTVEYPVKWNSLKNSVTVKEGSIRSYRLYREVKR
jgi:hypothetical protein